MGREIHIDCDEKVIELFYVKDNKKLKAELQALRENLKEIEFSVTSYGSSMKLCPVCNGGNVKMLGHKPDCWLSEQISKLEEPK
jgi:hypothetical protein